MFVEENFGFKVKDDEILPDNFDFSQQTGLFCLLAHDLGPSARG